MSLNFNFVEFWTGTRFLRCLGNLRERNFSPRRREKKRKKKGKILERFGGKSLEQIDSREEKKERGQECILGLEIRLERRKVTENYGLHGSFLLIASRNASSRRINWG